MTAYTTPPVMSEGLNQICGNDSFLFNRLLGELSAAAILWPLQIITTRLLAFGLRDHPSDNAQSSSSDTPPNGPLDSE